MDALSPPPTPDAVRLRCVPAYRELAALLDVLRTPTGTAAARQRRASTFSYERLMSRTGEDADGGVEHHDDDIDSETRLTMTVNAVTPQLTASIATLKDSAATVEEKCLALDELLYLVEGAWTMPIVGREVAYHVCDVLREQGGIDMLLSNLSGRTIDAADTQTADVIVLMSAIILSQVSV